MIRRSDPVPLPPPGLTDDQFQFSLEVKFKKPKYGSADSTRRVLSGLSTSCEPPGRANARPMTGSAKQSMAPRKRMDCFAALAMTLLELGPSLAVPDALKERPHRPPNKNAGESLAGIFIWNDSPPDQVFFSIGQTLLSSGMKASSAGMVATRL